MNQKIKILFLPKHVFTFFQKFSFPAQRIAEISSGHTRGKTSTGTFNVHRNPMTNKIINPPVRNIAGASSVILNLMILEVLP